MLPKRKGDRPLGEFRKVKITPNYLRHHPGSALIEMGETIVLCTASIEEGVPSFLKNTGKGWLTAEYSMLPMSSGTRIPREAVKGKIGGRTQEIQRLIGRSLRAVTNLAAIAGHTVHIDCDVIQADGGTRTAAITGGFIALAKLFMEMKSSDGALTSFPLTDYVSAVSAGIVNGCLMLDLDYQEDYQAEVDMNFVMTGRGRFIEVQGTAENGSFDRQELIAMTDMAAFGIERLINCQREILGGVI